MGVRELCVSHYYIPDTSNCEFFFLDPPFHEPCSTPLSPLRSGVRRFNRRTLSSLLSREIHISSRRPEIMGCIVGRIELRETALLRMRCWDVPKEFAEDGMPVPSRLGRDVHEQ